MTEAAASFTPVVKSELVCPFCRATHTETMPMDACIHFFECAACGTMLRPKPGDCCVFCSYGSVPCPPAQLARTEGGTSRGCCG